MHIHIYTYKYIHIYTYAYMHIYISASRTWASLTNKEPVVRSFWQVMIAPGGSVLPCRKLHLILRISARRGRNQEKEFRSSWKPFSSKLTYLGWTLLELQFLFSVTKLTSGNYFQGLQKKYFIGVSFFSDYEDWIWCRNEWLIIISSRVKAAESW